MDRLETIVVPFKFILDNATITIYEVTKSELVSGDVWYHVLLSINVNGKESKPFSLDVRNFDELKKKLLIEISKYKLAEICKMRIP